MMDFEKKNDYIECAHQSALESWQEVCRQEGASVDETTFKAGFLYACSMLIGLLRECAPHVYRTQEAEHMLDGFGPRSTRHFDVLADRLKEILK